MLDHAPEKQLWFLKLLLQSGEEFAACARGQEDSAERTRAVDFAAAAHNAAFELLGRLSVSPEQKAQYGDQLHALANALMELEQ